MENRARQKTKRMEWLTKYCRMLTKMLRSPIATSQKASAVSVSGSPHRAVCCEELFLPSQRKKGHRHTGGYCGDPFVAAHISAQNHFTFRPNIHI
ncbi:hypothetical protein PTKIN_Ptkin12aG0070600 [Pterospermum kingtungense]